MPKKSPVIPLIPDVTDIKLRTIVALFSDDSLMNDLVLKGGNALYLCYGLAARTSYDLDFSIPSEFNQNELTQIQGRIEHRLKQSFNSVQLSVFDVELSERPKTLSDDLKDFWGGYNLTFKLAQRHIFDTYKNDIDELRRRAVPVGANNSTRLVVEISKHEYCAEKQAVELEDHTIYVYSLPMIVCEKLRAICQQMPEYSEQVMKHRAARARDFFDIHTIISKTNFDPRSDTIQSMLKTIFEAKHVSLTLLSEIPQYREFHRTNWEAVEATVRPDETLQEFDYYFDAVVNLVGKLQSGWNI